MPMSLKYDFYHKEIGLLLIVFLLSRFFLLIVFPETLISSDSLEYIELSQNLKSNHVFERNGYPETYRTPGYPLYLAAFWLLGNSNVQFVISSQIILLAISSVIYFRLSQYYFSNLAAYITWFLIFLDPGNLLIGVSLLSEALFVFFISMFMYVWHRLIHRESFINAVLLGLICGLICLIRPIAVYLFIICSLAIFLSQSLFKRKSSIAVFFLLGVFLTQGAWVFRNYLHYNKIYLTEISSASLYVYWAQAVYAETSGANVDELYNLAWKEWDAEKQHLTPPEMKRLFLDKAIVKLKESPFYIIKVLFNGFSRLVIDSGFNKYIAINGNEFPLSINEIKHGLLFYNGLNYFFLSLLSVFCRFFEVVVVLFIHASLVFVPLNIKIMARQPKCRAIIIMAFIVSLYLIIFSSAPSANVRFREQYYCLAVFLSSPILVKMIHYFRINLLSGLLESP